MEQAQRGRQPQRDPHRTDTDNLRRWNEVASIRNHYYCAYFTSGMPDLKSDHVAAHREIHGIGHFWPEKGVDGRFLGRIPRRDGKTDPEVFLVREVWTDDQEARQCLPGLRSVFNFEMAGAILDTVANGRGAGLAARHAGLRQRYGDARPNFIDATFLSNHDQNRVMSVLGDDQDCACVAASLLLTLPGSPFTYYGEEIGMRGMNPDFFVRELMLWQSQPDSWRARSREIRHSKDHKVEHVAAETKDAQSLLNHHKSLSTFRKDTPALASGDLEPVEDLHERLIAFVCRHPSGGDVLVIHNASRRTTTIGLPPSLAIFCRAIWRASGMAEVTGEKTIVPPRPSVVLGEG